MQNIGPVLVARCGPPPAQIVRPVQLCDSSVGVPEPDYSLSCPHHGLIAAGRNVQGLTQLMPFGHVERDTDRPDRSTVQVQQEFGSRLYPADATVRSYDSEFPLGRQPLVESANDGLGWRSVIGMNHLRKNGG